MKYTHQRGLSYYANVIYRECNSENLEFGSGQGFVDGSGKRMGVTDYDVKGAVTSIADRHNQLHPG